MGGPERPAGRSDPAKLTQALSTVAEQAQSPRCFVVADAIGIAEQKAADLQEQINAWRDLSASLAIDEADTAAEPASA